MKSVFAGIYEKLIRTDENIVNLESEVLLFFQECKYPVMPKVHDKEHAEALEYHKTLPIPLRFSVLSGEIVHHLRSCLDHIVWELSDDVTRNSKDGPSLEFPVLDRRPTPENEFPKYGRKVKGVKHIGALKLIEELQPYNRTHPNTDPLWIIHKMDIANKHRELAITQPSGFLEGPLNLVREVRRRLLLKLQMSPELIREFDQYGKVTPQVSFRDFSGGIVEPVIPKLVQLTGHIRYVLMRFEKVLV
jgi:hypothetical protein